MASTKIKECIMSEAKRICSKSRLEDWRRLSEKMTFQLNFEGQIEDVRPKRVKGNILEAGPCVYEKAHHIFKRLLVVQD